MNQQPVSWISNRFSKLATGLLESIHSDWIAPLGCFASFSVVFSKITTSGVTKKEATQAFLPSSAKSLKKFNPKMQAFTLVLDLACK